MSDKKPTPKQVRYHYKKIARLERTLRRSLYEAYRANVVVYKFDKETEAEFKGHYVCNALEDMWQKFQRATNERLLEAYHSEVMQELMK